MTSGKKAREERAAKVAAAAPKESKLKPILGAVIALVAIVAIGAAIWAGTRQAGEATTGSAPALAQGENGGILLNPTEPAADVPVIDVYEDFQCHWCKVFHEILGPRLDELATSGEAKVVIHMKNFLDRGQPGDSTRIANAAACAADVSPQAFLQVRDALMNAQPDQEQGAEPQAGWPAETMTQIADDAGISGDQRATYDRCVSDQSYQAYIQAVDEQSARDGVQATPTYKINGEDFDLGQVLAQDGTQNPQAFDQAVQAARQ